MLFNANDDSGVGRNDDIEIFLAHHLHCNNVKLLFIVAFFVRPFTANLTHQRTCQLNQSRDRHTDLNIRASVRARTRLEKVI